MTTEQQYKAAIYFAVATIFFYDKNLDHSEIHDAEKFAANNPELRQRVFEECMNCLNYELSYHQMMTAILAFLKGKQRPKDVKTSIAYVSGNDKH